MVYIDQNGVANSNAVTPRTGLAFALSMNVWSDDASAGREYLTENPMEVDIRVSGAATIIIRSKKLDPTVPGDTPTTTSGHTGYPLVANEKNRIGLNPDDHFIVSAACTVYPMEHFRPND